MAGELDAQLADVVPHRASEASAEFAGEVYMVNARHGSEALERVMRLKLVVDLLLRALEPGWWRTPRFETGAIAEFDEQCHNGARHRCGG
jgi:hypothetical protein